MKGLDILILTATLFSVFTALSVAVLSLIWIERKLLGRLQRRLGPTRTGPFGLLQPVADGIKLIVKEDLVPSWADRIIFWTAPLLVIIPSFMIWVTIPISRNLVVENLDLGLFVIVALLVISILGLVLAGWGSANKYGALGSLRAAAQLVSYEVPLVLVVISVAVISGSMDLRVISAIQVPLDTAQPILDEARSNFSNFNHVGLPLIFIFPLGLFIFLLAGLAEVGRTPFDIYFAESEIVGGPFVEYSGAHWSVFFLAEYMNTFAVAALAGLLFLGGWYGPILPEWAWFLIKTYFFVVIIFWIRGTFPRLRIDQLMAFGWKILMPLSLMAVIMAAIYRFYEWPAWSLSLMSLSGLIVVGFAFYLKYTRPVLRLAKKYGHRPGGTRNVR